MRRLCDRATKMGVSFSTFKQESLEAALAHVVDLGAGRQPTINSTGAFYRLLSRCPPRAWRWEHLEGLRDARIYDVRGEGGG